LNTDNLGAAKSFYKKMFKWKLTDMKMGPGMTYTMVEPGQQPGGGMQEKPMPEAPTIWLAYVAVDNLSKSIGKARKLGAQIMVESQEVPGMGSFGIFLDPTGAPLGVWEAAKKTASKRATPKKNGRAKAARSPRSRRARA
jgi:predicted enzyme related to lactoylglutathione lyase